MCVGDFENVLKPSCSIKYCAKKSTEKTIHEFYLPDFGAEFAL
jgi:hypothetical protein